MTALLILFASPLIAWLFEFVDFGHIAGSTYFDWVVVFFAVSHIAFLFAVVDSCYRKPQSLLNILALILTGILNLLPQILPLFFELSERHFRYFFSDAGICAFILLALFIFAIVAGMCAISLKRLQIFIGLFILAILEYLSVFAKESIGIGIFFSVQTFFTVVLFAFRELARFLIFKWRSRKIQKISTENNIKNQ